MLRRLTNQTLGKQFEARLMHQARITGLWLMHAGTTIKYLHGGKTQAVKSDLDFKLYARDSRMAAFDAKSKQGDHFTYSQLTPHQIVRASEYAAWGVKAGFVVHLRALKEVYWYPIQVINEGGRRARFDASNGHLLGKETWFCLHPVLPDIKPL